MLASFYGVMGNPPDVDGAYVVMATALASHTHPSLVNLALNRCMVECRFPVRLPDIFSRVPGFDVDVNAEKRLAWDTVLRFVRKYVGNDVYGNFGPEHGWYPKSFPELSQRLLDTVRRTGGWAVYARLGEDDFPHQQKRFFEEYQAWTEIQHVAADPAKVLIMPPPPKALIAAPVVSVKNPEPEKNPEPVKNRAPDFYALPTPGELADRAIFAKARLAQYMKQKQDVTSPEV